MNLKRKLWAVCILALAVSILSPISSNAALIQKGAAPGAKWGRVDGGGPFTKACPAGYVVTGVAVANSESFGYTTGFSFTCTQITDKGELGTTTSTITQVTNNPSNASSICPTGYVLIGVRILLRWDPNNNAVYYVNDMGANCAKFTDKTQTFNATMARNVKLGGNNEYLDRESSCSAGFVTGFDGRSGAGLDYAGVTCSTFTDENEGKPSPSYLVIKETPKISQTATTMVCKGGEYLFMRFGAIEEKSAITERVFILMRDSATIATLTITGKTEGSFSKSTTEGTYTCTEQARQENSLAISDSSSKITQSTLIKANHKADLKKNIVTKQLSDSASRAAYLKARSAAADLADNSRAALVPGSKDFYSALRAITAQHKAQVDAARNEFQASLEKNAVALRNANEKSLANYYLALENAGLSILVKKS